MLRLLLVRHGESVWNEEERIQGQQDVPLSENGRRQAMALGERLQGVKINACFASPLKRAKETAELILKASGNSLSIVTLPELMERNFGEWEGKCVADLKSQNPDQFAQWVVAHYLPAPPKGESVEDLLKRVEVGLKRILSKVRKGNVLIVGHGGSVRAAICKMFRLPPESFAKLRVNNASLTVLELHERRPRLCQFNDIYHLRNEGSPITKT